MAVAAIPLILTAVSTAVSVAGVVMSAQAANKSARFNEQVAEQNAVIAGQQGEQAARIQRMRSYQQLSSIRANAGASGVDVDGSVLDVLGQSAADAKFDELNTKYNAQLQVRGYSNSASLDAEQARNATTGGYISAASALVGGAAATYNYSQKGSPGNGITRTANTSGGM